MESGDLVRALMEALEEKRVPEGMTIADLMRLETQLADSLRIVRSLLDAAVRSAGSDL